MINSISSIKRIISQLNYLLSAKQKRQSIIVFASMIVTSLLELLGVSSIYPLLQLMMIPEETKDKWYISWIYILFQDIEYKYVLFIFCMIIVFVFISKNLLAIFFSYVQVRFAHNFMKETSTEMLRKYLLRPYEYFINTNSSIILRGIGTDTGSVYSVLLCLFQSLGEVLTILLLAIFLFMIDAVVSISALFVAGICFICIVVGFKGKIKAAGKMYRVAVSSEAQCGYQAVNGIKEILVLDRRAMFINQYEKYAEQVAKCGIVHGVIDSCPDRILEGVCMSGFIAIIGIKLIICGSSTAFIPVLGSFAMGAFKILPSISKISTRINTIVYNQFGLQNCYEIFKEAEHIESENKRLGVDYKEEFDSDISPVDRNEISFKNSIIISNISWSYMNSSSEVLSGLSMEIKKGESIAFVGSSGAGKTTLADIIMGLLKPQSGSVEMDDTDIFLIPRLWHKQIGYVPQSVYLIDDTIRSNVAFGLPANLISDERVWSALEQAQFKSFVEKLPNGLDTIVGERGVKFSGGQRQRIALARALYENPEILVLDEATSALDNETESAVMESIEALQGHKTLIIIAHRLTTIRNCDRIYKIENGVAVETTYEQLTKE